MTQQLWDFHGGIHPPERKELSNRTPIRMQPLPARLILPLLQHIGLPAEPCVEAGQHVLKGQKIATAAGILSVPLHAPTSGTISAIGDYPYPHASGLPARAIVLDSDGLDQWLEHSGTPDYQALPREMLLELIREAGISGLGGAGFPTAVKLDNQKPIETLIINGTECEPYITADDLLMREKTAELIAGIAILAHLLQPQQVLIGIEDNKPEAIAAVQAAIGDQPFQVRVLPTRYPSGGERQLIQLLTGKEVPSAGLPADLGIICQNVGTCVAVHDAVLLGRPLISRITTLTGEALGQPGNVETLIGTPVRELLTAARLDRQQLQKLILGGPMMGFTLDNLETPVIKTSNCLIAANREELPDSGSVLPCIRCGECAKVCPASLLPQQLHFFAQGQDNEQLKAYNLFDCIECGACAYVCPSSLPLVQYYRAAKGEIRELEQKQRKSEHARLRFEQRQERLRLAEEQKEAERKARTERAAARAKAADAPAASTAAQTDEALKKLKIAASMAQVALKKAEKQLATHDTPELHAQVSQLRTAADAAQQALVDAQGQSGMQAASTGNTDAALKKAQIEAAMLRAQLRKLEQLETPSDAEQNERSSLQEKLQQAEQALAELEKPAAPAPASDALKKAKIEAAMLRAQLRKLEKLQDAEQTLARLESAPADAPDTPPAANPALDALKKAKIHLAMKRAELKKAEKAEADEEVLGQLRQALQEAEQALHQAEAASGKPEPQLVRTPPRNVDERLRALKTEIAFARADLRKLEREDADDAALAQARERLEKAERQLAIYHSETSG